MSINKVIYEGLKNYKKIWKKLMILSIFLGIYMNLFKIYDYSTRTIDRTSNLYLLSIIILIAIVIPYYYFYISLFTTYAATIKNEIDNTPYKLKMVFDKEKLKFLRVFLVLIFQSIVKIIIATLFISLIVSDFNWISMLFIAALLCLSLFYIRMDLSLSIIYWNIKDINTSKLPNVFVLKDILLSRYITRTYFLKKAVIILIANIPNIIIDLLNLYSSIRFISNKTIGILAIVFIVIFTIITRPFKLSIYHALYKQLNLLPFADKLVDQDGTEWIS